VRVYFRLTGRRIPTPCDNITNDSGATVMPCEHDKAGCNLLGRLLVQFILACSSYSPSVTSQLCATSHSYFAFVCTLLCHITLCKIWLRRTHCQSPILCSSEAAAYVTEHFQGTCISPTPRRPITPGFPSRYTALRSMFSPRTKSQRLSIMGATYFRKWKVTRL
jgi:hypothetical protein